MLAPSEGYPVERKVQPSKCRDNRRDKREPLVPNPQDASDGCIEQRSDSQPYQSLKEAVLAPSKGYPVEHQDQPAHGGQDGREHPVPDYEKLCGRHF